MYLLIVISIISTTFRKYSFVSYNLKFAVNSLHIFLTSLSILSPHTVIIYFSNLSHYPIFPLRFSVSEGLVWPKTYCNISFFHVFPLVFSQVTHYPKLWHKSFISVLSKSIFHSRLFFREAVMLINSITILPVVIQRANIYGPKSDCYWHCRLYYIIYRKKQWCCQENPRNFFLFMYTLIRFLVKFLYSN